METLPYTREDLQQDQPSGTSTPPLLFSAWLLSSSQFTCSIKVLFDGVTSASASLKMDTLIRTRRRRRTPVLLYILLHILSAQAGKYEQPFQERRKIKVQSVNYRDTSICMAPLITWFSANSILFTCVLFHPCLLSVFIVSLKAVENKIKRLFYKYVTTFC